TSVVDKTVHKMLQSTYIKFRRQSMAKKRLTISLAEEVYKELEELAKNAGLSKSAYITTLVINTGKDK
ncbi:ribbon-helix-helix protein, CopG family, partial [Streptococcus suis]